MHRYYRRNSLANIILQKLDDWGLDIQDLRGQRYERASNTLGKFKGVQARLKEENQKALYDHCASHYLSVCILKACGVLHVRNMFELSREVSLFISSSPKRQRKLCLKVSLLQHFLTRWFERHADRETFADLYTVVCGCFGQLVEAGYDKWNSDSLTRA